MWKYYVIMDEKGKLSAQFFLTRDEAEEFMEDNYYKCSGDVLSVPQQGEGE